MTAGYDARSVRSGFDPSVTVTGVSVFKMINLHNFSCTNHA